MMKTDAERTDDVAQAFSLLSRESSRLSVHTGHFQSNRARKANEPDHSVKLNLRLQGKFLERLLDGSIDRLLQVFRHEVISRRGCPERLLVG